MDIATKLSDVRNLFPQVFETVIHYKQAKPDRETRDLARRLGDEQALFDHFVRQLLLLASAALKERPDEGPRTIENKLGTNLSDGLINDLHQMEDFLRGLKADLASTSRGTEVLAKLHFRSVYSGGHYPRTGLQKRLDKITTSNKRLSTYLLPRRIACPLARGFQESLEVISYEALANCHQAKALRLDWQGPSCAGGHIFRGGHWHGDCTQHDGSHDSESSNSEVDNYQRKQRNTFSRKTQGPEENINSSEGEVLINIGNFKGTQPDWLPDSQSTSTTCQAAFRLRVTDTDLPPTAVPLSDLIENHQIHMNTQQRMGLAFRLSTTISLLWSQHGMANSSAWSAWTVWFDREDKDWFNKPYLSPGIHRKNQTSDSADSLSTVFRLLARDPVLCLLGMRLVEISFGDSLTQMRKESEKLLSQHVDLDRDTLDLLTARKILEFKTIGPRFGKMLEEVINVCLNQQYRDLENAVVRVISVKNLNFLDDTTISILLPLYSLTGAHVSCARRSSFFLGTKGKGNEALKLVRAELPSSNPKNQDRSSGSREWEHVHFPSGDENSRAQSELKDSQLRNATHHDPLTNNVHTLAIRKGRLPSGILVPSESNGVSLGESRDYLDRSDMEHLHLEDQSTSLHSLPPPGQSILNSNPSEEEQPRASISYTKTDPPEVYSTLASGSDNDTGDFHVHANDDPRLLSQYDGNAYFHDDSDGDDDSVSSFRTRTATTDWDFPASENSEELPVLPENHRLLGFLNITLRVFMWGFNSWRQQMNQQQSRSGSIARNESSYKRMRMGSSSTTGRGLDSQKEEKSGGTVRPGSKKRRLEESSRTLACPYFKQSPTRHSGCCSYILSRIRDVKQHLDRCHKMPVYCPKCFAQTFSDEDQRDEHLRSANCQLREGTKPEGITEAMKKKLKKRSAQNQTEEEQWYTIFEVLFSAEEQKPGSPYMELGLLQDVEAFQRFTQTHGPQIMEEVFTNHGYFQSLDLHNDDRRGFLHVVMQEGFRRIADSWTSTGGTTATGPPVFATTAAQPENFSASNQTSALTDPFTADMDMRSVTDPSYLTSTPSQESSSVCHEDQSDFAALSTQSELGDPMYRGFGDPFVWDFNSLPPSHQTEINDACMNFRNQNLNNDNHMRYM